MKSRLKEIKKYLSIADVKENSFIFYCLCMELIEIIEELLNADKKRKRAR